MDITVFNGRWKEPQGTPHGELVWINPGKGGLQTHTATVAGKQVATLRKHLHEQGYSVRVAGWVWTKPLAGSVAAKIGVGETDVKGFANLRDAKQAVKYALECLPDTAGA